MDLDKCVARNQHFSPKVLPMRNTFATFSRSRTMWNTASHKAISALMALSYPSGCSVSCTSTQKDEVPCVLEKISEKKFKELKDKEE